MKKNDTIRVCLIGAGQRGTQLARQLNSFSGKVKLVAVADPRVEVRSTIANEFSLPVGSCFAGWEELIKSGIPCDAVIIATLDNQHTRPVLASLEQGWDILLEKPVADSFEDVQRIEKARESSGRIISVCQTLRYKKNFRKVKELVEEGLIGDVVTMDHLEGIGNIRFTHNYVRGKWGRVEDNTFLLLHKSSHDLDFISWIINKPCIKVSSYGGLKYFNPEYAPVGAPLRCENACPVEKSCIYSALRLYVNGDRTSWPANTVSSDHSLQSHLEAIKTGPFGKCVWKSGNNVVDHQIVAMEFEGNVTATFTMSGFTSFIGRQTRIYGTKGDLLFDEAKQEIIVAGFDSGKEVRFTFEPDPHTHPEDREIVHNWLEAVYNRDSSIILVDIKEAFKSHAMVFAAEKSRRERKIVYPEFSSE
jgi:predicted dehydrogenase